MTEPSQSAVLPRCAAHAEHSGDMCCDGCRKFFCWRAVAYSATDDVFRCADCAAECEVLKSQRTALSLLAMPGFYVLALVLFAALLFVLGVGHTSEAELRRLDAERKWHEQKLPKAWLKQLSRVSARIEWLESAGKSKEAAHWSALAHKRLTALGDYWAETPVAVDIDIAQAHMLARTGDSETAHRQITALGNAVPRDGDRYLSYLFIRGHIAELGGDADAAEADWRRVMDALVAQDGQIGRGFDKMVDNMLGQYTDKKAELNMTNSVRRVCRTTRSSQFLVAELRQRLNIADGEMVIGFDGGPIFEEDEIEAPEANPDNADDWVNGVKPGEGGGDPPANKPKPTFEIEKLE